jgi:Antirepressor regulating drug resistance, predicted signal transduction N-terminal membrane component
MSYTAGYVILFVIGIRLLLKKAPKLFSYILWSVVLLRLLCPFSLNSVWSLLPANSVTAPITSLQPMGILEVRGGITSDTGKPSLPAVPVKNAGKSSDSLQVWISISEVIWLLGIAVLIIHSSISLVRLRKKLVGAVKHHGNIYFTDHINEPFVMGLIHPRIYLPSTLSEHELEYIILHEQTHIRRHDHITKVLAFTALAIHWFNPLVWAAFFLFGNDMEMSCDESVMKQMDTDIRREYSTSLLEFASGRKMISGAPLTFSEGDIKSRIKNVMSYKKPSFWAIVVAFFAVAAAAAGLAVNPHPVRDTLQWAKNLKAGDVSKIELFVMPAKKDESYRLFDNSDFNAIVKLINTSRGKYIKKPEAIAGGSIIFYITLADGTRHMVGNNGNRYLVIDGDSFIAGYQWLSSWKYTKGNAVVPTDFNFDNNLMLTMEELKMIARKGKDISWEDFSKYKGTDVGSGLYIRQYPIKGHYYVLIGGADTEAAPMYVKLYDSNTKQYIDLRTDNIDDFLKKTAADNKTADDTNANEANVNNSKIDNSDTNAINTDRANMDKSNTDKSNTDGANTSETATDITDNILNVADKNLDNTNDDNTAHENTDITNAENTYAENTITENTITGNGEIIIDNIGSVMWYLRRYQGKNTGTQNGFKRYELVREELDPERTGLKIMDDAIWNAWGKWSNVLVSINRFLYLAAKDEKESSLKSPVLVSISRKGNDRRIYEAPHQTINQLTVDQASDKIYFTGIPQEQTFPQPLYEIDEKLKKATPVLQLNGWLIEVYNDYAYYFAADQKQPGIYRIAVSGKKKPELCDKVGYIAGNIRPVIHSQLLTNEAGETTLSYLVKKQDGDVKGTIPIGD